MTAQLEFDESELQLIAATTMMMQRVMSVGAAQHLARQFMKVPIELTRADLNIVAAMMGALQREIKRDKVLPHPERMRVIRQAQTIINKIEESLHARPPAIV